MTQAADPRQIDLGLHQADLGGVGELQPELFDPVKATTHGLIAAQRALAFSAMNAFAASVGLPADSQLYDDVVGGRPVP